MCLITGLAFPLLVGGGGGASYYLGVFAKLVIYHDTTVVCNCAAGLSGVFKPIADTLNNVFLFRLKGLKGIIRSLPLTLPHFKACTGPARIHWSCLVFSL